MNDSFTVIDALGEACKAELGFCLFFGMEGPIYLFHIPVLATSVFSPSPKPHGKLVYTPTVFIILKTILKPFPTEFK